MRFSGIRPFPENCIAPIYFRLMENVQLMTENFVNLSLLLEVENVGTVRCMTINNQSTFASETDPRGTNQKELIAATGQQDVRRTRVERSRVRITLPSRFFARESSLKCH